MAVCLVTGGAGFIGSHLVDALVARDQEVRVLDNFSTGVRANLSQVQGKIELITGDLTDLDVVRSASRGVDLVFHQAALASVPRSIADPMLAHHACATGTLNVLVAARETGIRRIIYAASGCVTGNGGHSYRREGEALPSLSPYAVAKLAGEQYCAAFSHVYGLDTVGLRYFHVFGPRQSRESPYSHMIPTCLEAMIAGRNPVLHGDGLQTCDFTFVDDVIQANLLAAEAPRVAGMVYNIASGRRTTLLELVAILNRVLGTRLKPIHSQPRPGDVHHGVADIARAQAELGYCPCTDLEQNLRSSLDHLGAKPEEKTFASKSIYSLN